MSFIFSMMIICWMTMMINNAPTPYMNMIYSSFEVIRISNSRPAPIPLTIMSSPMIIFALTLDGLIRVPVILSIRSERSICHFLFVLLSFCLLFTCCLPRPSLFSSFIIFFFKKRTIIKPLIFYYVSDNLHCTAPSLCSHSDVLTF